MEMQIEEILSRMGVSAEGAEITRMLREEDGEPYGVWTIQSDRGCFILKEAKEYEAEAYNTFLREAAGYVPKVFGHCAVGEQTWLLMEFIPGTDLRNCTRPGLKLALDALIGIQRDTWNSGQYADACYSFEQSLPGRERRGQFLGDPALEAAYAQYLRLYKTVPRALCHDDLLPFNVLVTGDRAVLIDWECAGLLPYPTALARLIAHGEDKEDAFFRMTQADREFAIEYYYQQLLKDKGISTEEWRRTLRGFLFYEYCEWVMLGNRYDDRDNDRYRRYRALAGETAEELLSNSPKNV